MQPSSSIFTQDFRFESRCNHLHETNLLCVVDFSDRGIKLDCFGSEERIAVIPSKGHFAWPFRRVRALVRNQLIIFSCFDNSTVLFLEKACKHLLPIPKQVDLYRDREPNIVVAFGDEVPAECTSTIFGVYCNLQLVSGAVTGMIIEDIGKNVNL